jgi:hypothetical protein
MTISNAQPTRASSLIVVFVVGLGRIQAARLAGSSQASKSSSAVAAIEPWEWKEKGPVALEEQVRLYGAAIAAMRESPWLRGAYWWHWRAQPPADPKRDTDYTPQGKPAWDVLRDFYRRAPFGAGQSR